jgi:hypothetical protein
MSLNHGSKVATNGLTLCYDLDNKKSWKGEPTTNNSSLSHHTNWNNSGTATWDFDDTSLDRLFEDAPIKSMTKDTNGNSHLGIGNGSITAATYTASCYVYIPSSAGTLAGTPPYFRSFPANTSRGYLQYDGSYDWNNDWPKDKWIRISADWNNTASDTSMYISCYINTTGNKIYMTAPQLEEKSYATPFVNGTRANTSAILNIAGSQAITAESLTYNSDGVTKPTFGANSDYITIGDFDDIFGSGSIDASLEFWIKPPVTGTRIFVGRFPPSVSDHRFYIGSYGSEWDMGWGAYPWNSGHSGTRPARDADQWQHIVVSISSGVASLYKNGVLGFTKTDTSVSQGAVPFTIGAYFNTSAVIDNSYHSAEDIDVVRVYNRALTAEEINQNFTAIRGRFGL